MSAYHVIARGSKRTRLIAGTLLMASLLGAAGADKKPGLASANPRGIQRGETVRIRLTGTNLVALTGVRFSNTNLTATLEDGGRTNFAIIDVQASPDLARGAYDLSVTGTNGTSASVKLYVDDVPQLTVRETNPAPRSVAQPERLPSLPVAIWGVLERPGDIDAFEFEVKAKETIVLDLAGKSVGSKIASAEILVLDSSQRVLAHNGGFDGGEPLLTFTPSRAGRYTARVQDRMVGGSSEHSYRLTIGALPYVTGIFPLGVPAYQTSAVQLLGYNLGRRPSVDVNAAGPGETPVPLDASRFRARREFKVLASAAPEFVEAEPNDTPSSANPVSVPGAANGRLLSGEDSADTDLFRFHATAGRRLVIETQAAQRGSPADTKIEILDANGQPVPRLRLQAVRDSFLNFRPIDSVQPGARLENWEEMDLNNYIYLNGEVARLFRMPQGPDSDLLFYTSAGKRRAYFDTSATGHALEEPCYVVEPRRLDEPLAANGLPVFTVAHANDDDGERKLGTDSKIYFMAPTTGDYLVRVTDSRRFQGDRFVYRLVVRDAAPDFKVTLNGANPTVPRGSGQSFSVSVDRIDGFDGAVRVEITNVPPGFIVSTPLVIEAGHGEAKGTIFALTNAHTTTNAPIPIKAVATIDGRPVEAMVNPLGQLKVGAAPKLFVSFEPYTSAAETNIVEPPADQPLEITIAPGQTVPAWLKIRRNGHKELVTFQVENLPHGVIVDNIGLNGVLIPKEDNERQIFLACARWVEEQDRLCYAIEQNAGRQTSRPLLLKVRRATTAAAAR